MDISPESLKVLVSQVLDQKTSKKLDTIIDVGSFLWEVVDKINDTTKNSKLTLQEKEDLLVKISENVVNFLEEKGVITIDLASRFRGLIKTADVFLDVVLGLYSFVNIKTAINNPSTENCFKTMFSFISCFSKKAAAVVENKPEPIIPNPKVEEVVKSDKDVDIKMVTESDILKQITTEFKIEEVIKSIPENSEETGIYDIFEKVEEKTRESSE